MNNPLNPFESPAVASVASAPRPVRMANVCLCIFLVALFSIPFTHGIYVWQLDQEKLPAWLSREMRTVLCFVTNGLFILSQLTAAVAFMAWLAVGSNEKRAK